MIHCIILFALISINNGDIGEGIVQFDKYVLVGNKELGLDDHINSYDAANAYCQNNYGTTLASISKDDSDDLSALRAAIESVNSPQFDEHVFIGARYDSTPTESKWKWADGTDAPFSDETYFTGYFNGPPSVRGCVFAYANFQHPLPIEFNNGACNNPAGFFLCAKSPGCLSGATEDKCGDGASCQSDGTCVCNPGYTGDGTSCTPSTSCLSGSNGGCHIISSESECLSSKDGRGYLPTYGGYKVYDEPCVYCNGQCTGHNGNVCEPRDWLLNQPNQLNPNLYQTASCVDCLSGSNAGCHLIRTESECLSSKDGRGYLPTAGGHRVYNEPCVYCGGQRCTGHNGNVCEPKHWLLNQPNQLNTNLYQIASCAGSGPSAKSEPQFEDYQYNDYGQDNNDNEWKINLSSTEVMSFGGLLSIILCVNIICIYINCNGKRRRRNKGYGVVGYDSEEFDESEANAINIVNE